MAYRVSRIAYRTKRYAICDLRFAMTVHIKLYAGLRRYKPDVPVGQAFACDVAEDCTVQHLLTQVLNLPAREVAIALVNGVHRGNDYLLKDGDVVALWTPIAGG